MIGEIDDAGGLVLSRELDVYGTSRLWAAAQGEKDGTMRSVGDALYHAAQAPDPPEPRKKVATMLS